MIDKRKHRAFPTFWVGIAAGALVMGGVFAGSTALVSSLSAEKATAEEGLAANAEQLERVGLDPVATPEPKEESNPTRRVTEEQVRTIVRAELSELELTGDQISQIARLAAARVSEPEPGPRGERGRRGKPGPPPAEDVLREVVLEAAQQVCADGACDGADGTDGQDGTDGASAYDIAVANGFEGTAEEWLASLEGTDGTNGTDGTDGANGLSAYQIAVANGFEGTEQEWLASLEGDKGDTGDQGPRGERGPVGPVCIDGSDPMTWHVDKSASVLIGLPEGTYKICPYRFEESHD